MGQTKTPSGITDGQIDGVGSFVTNMLRERSEEFDPEKIDVLLENGCFAEDMCEALRRNEKMLGRMIERAVKVDRTLSFEEMLAATGRHETIDENILWSIRNEGKGRVAVFFFKLEYVPTVSELEVEYRRRSLVPADPYTLAAANVADSGLADKHPNRTEWTGASDVRFCLEFYRSVDLRDAVRVRECGSGDSRNGCCGSMWWFTGVRT